MYYISHESTSRMKSRQRKSANRGEHLLRIFSLAQFLAFLIFCQSASAENHGLVLTIGAYSNSSYNLPGLDLDNKAASRMMKSLNVSERNLLVAHDNELTSSGLANQLDKLLQKLGPNDSVFIYYSGHGTQLDNLLKGGRKCSEGLVSHDLKVFLDRDLQEWLNKAQSKAQKVVMFNDSCFSGGAAEKSSIIGIKAKAIPYRVLAQDKSFSVTSVGQDCGQPINKSFSPVLSTRLLYIAAAADNEVAYASDEGSLATQAWAACLEEPSTDADHSGSITGNELRDCAQKIINKNRYKKNQTITIVGEPELPVTNSRSGSNTAPVNLHGLLTDIKSNADKQYTITLTSQDQQIKIGRDFLSFSVESPIDGYVYILQAGSEGDKLTMLFPNKIDKNNRLPSGKHRFPQQNWLLKSNGPQGDNYLLAVVASEEIDFESILKSDGPFSSIDALLHSITALTNKITEGTSPHSRRYWASDILTIKEIN